MKLTNELLEFMGEYRKTFNWILSASGTRSLVIAMGEHFPLYLLAQVLVGRMKLRAAVTTEAEAVASVALHRPDLLVCSDWLESGNAVSCVQGARQTMPTLQVLMLLSHEGRGLRAGDLRILDPLVDAMVHEDDLSAEEAPLGAAFIALCRGQRYRSPSLRNQESSGAANPQGPQVMGLTAREEEVLGLMVRGLKDRQIAESLGLTYETARTYVKTVRRKLGGGSRLVAVASRWGR